MWPVEFGREESRRRFEYLVRPPQFGILPLEPLDLSVLVARQARPVSGVDLRSADPLAQRLGRSDAELLRDGGDRGPLRRVVRCYLSDHPDCTLPQLRRVLARSPHDPILLKRWSLRTHRGDSLQLLTANAPTQAGDAEQIVIAARHGATLTDA